MEKILIIIQLAATLSLTGIIWLVQILHYPLFNFADEKRYELFHASHMNRITYIVAPLMIAEVVSAALILFYPLPNVDRRILFIGAVLVAVIWLSTFLLQVPLHEKLAQGFDSKTHNSLIQTNWIRTVAWSLRAVLVLWLGWRAMR